MFTTPKLNFLPSPSIWPLWPVDLPPPKRLHSQAACWLLVPCSCCLTFRLATHNVQKADRVWDGASLGDGKGKPQGVSRKLSMTAARQAWDLPRRMGRVARLHVRNTEQWRDRKGPLLFLPKCLITIFLFNVAKMLHPLLRILLHCYSVSAHSFKNLNSRFVSPMWNLSWHFTQSSPRSPLCYDSECL